MRVYWCERNRPRKQTWHQARKGLFCTMAWLCSTASTGWPGQERAGIGSALLFLVSHSSSSETWGHAQNGWGTLSIMFFYFSPKPFFFSTHLEKCFVWPLGCENSLSKKRTNCAMKLGFGMMVCNLSLKGFLCPWLIHILQTFVTELQGPELYSSSDSYGLQIPQCL